MLLIVNLQFSEFSENGIGDLVVHLHFSDSVFWPNLDNRQSESLPKLALSYSQKKSTDRNSKFWCPVRRSGKVDGLV